MYWRCIESDVGGLKIPFGVKTLKFEQFLAKMSCLTPVSLEEVITKPVTIHTFVNVVEGTLKVF